jgi:Peptidase family M28
MDLNQTSEKLANDGMGLIKEICDVAYTRLPGSEGEQKAQKHMEKKLTDMGADEVEVNKYKVYSKFFLWWPRISIIFFYVSLGFYIVFPILGLICSIMALVNLIMKLLSFTFLDVFFKANPSSNVIAKLKAKNMGDSGKPKRIVAIGGHTDSNYEYPIGMKLGEKLLFVAIAAFLCMAYWILANLIHVILTAIAGHPIVDFTGSAWNVVVGPDWAFIIALFCIPYVTYVGFWMVRNLPVPGANDNLSGLSVAVEVLKHYIEHPEDRPKNVEYWAICFGSEEGGMMGSKYLSKKMKGQLDNGTFPAESIWIVNFDSIATIGPLVIATKEPLYRVESHNPEVYNQLAASAEKAGVDHKVKTISAGTDSAPFSRLGIPAVGIVNMGDGDHPANWHSRDDTPENCDVEGIKNSIKLTLQFVKDIDESLA